jgi:hypothetical protein
MSNHVLRLGDGLTYAEAKHITNMTEGRIMERSAPIPSASPSGAGSVQTSPLSESATSGVSWAAVTGGAFIAAALSLILLALGAGLGLSSVSPWSNTGASAAALGTAAIVWLIAAQVMASSLGGYVAGRLRTKWANVHTDEVYFRDTAHGLLVWAVGAVITAGLLATAATSVAGRAASAGAGPSAIMAGDQGDAKVAGPHAYYVDGLFRSDRPAADRSDAAVRDEAGRILANALRHGELSGPDQTYLAGLIAGRTGLSQAEANQRVSQVLTQAKDALDTARKAAARLSLWIFIALLSGAFCASYAATIGGRQRDHVKAF